MTKYYQSRFTIPIELKTGNLLAYNLPSGALEPFYFYIIATINYAADGKKLDTKQERDNANEQESFIRREELGALSYITSQYKKYRFIALFEIHVIKYDSLIVTK